MLDHIDPAPAPPSAEGGPDEALTFRIGVSMSGAISAGAYTAGVFDFLIEALDAWEAARASGSYDGPPGRAVLTTLVGASAGAITAGIGTVALADAPVPLLAADGSVLCRLRQLYEAWVVKPDLVSPDGRPDFLSTGDLEAEAAPVSVLNASILTRIAAEALQIASPGGPRPFVSATLHLYMTLTDLRGTPYSISFTGSDGYHMLSHASRAHFVVEGLGTSPVPSPFADDDPGTPLDARGLTSDPKPWRDMATDALASGAFPLGLAPLEVKGRYGAVKFPAGSPGSGPPEKVETAFDKAVFPDGAAYTTKAVDGGVIDNDPFEYARFTLMREPPGPNDRHGATASRAVLMIAPFPEAPPLIEEGEPPSALASIAKALLGALRQQVRFKPDQLLAARDEGVFSRFMVSPSRVPPRGGADREHPEKFTIASGLLGGFGGFVARPFRDHDYRLGRRNCQRFLRTSFLLPADRSYFDGWTPEARAAAGASVKRPDRDRRGVATGTSTDMLPIIPLYGTAAEEVPYPGWPRLSAAGFEVLARRIGERLDAVAVATADNSGLTRLMAWLWRAGLALGRRRIAEYVRWSIMADLVERDQIEGFAVPAGAVAGLVVPPDLLASLKLRDTPDPERGLVRAVLSRLAGPDFQYRSARGIARSLTVKPDVDAALPAVRDVLSRLEALPEGEGAAVRRVAWAKGAEVYVLARRSPRGLEALLRGRRIGTLFSPPDVD